MKLLAGRDRLALRVADHLPRPSLPLTAVIALDATPVQMGVLAAAGSVPSLVFGLGTGVWVDRRKKRPIMIATDYGRAILLLAVPVGAVFDILRIEHLYAIALTMGVLNMLFNIANRSMLPSLVARDELVEANSKLAVGRSASEVAGPGIGGIPGAVAHGAGCPCSRRADLCGIRPGRPVHQSPGA